MQVKQLRKEAELREELRIQEREQQRMEKHNQTVRRREEGEAAKKLQHQQRLMLDNLALQREKEFMQNTMLKVKDIHKLGREDLQVHNPKHNMNRQEGKVYKIKKGVVEELPMLVKNRVVRMLDKKVGMFHKDIVLG